MDMFSALLGKYLSGGGGSEPVLVSKSITSNGIYDPADDNADGFSSVTVDVPNTYTAADEDKVVHNGDLVAHGSDTVTTNGTVDTTLISSLIVNVTGGIVKVVKLTTTSTYVSDSDLYLVDTGSFIYIFGYVINTYSSSLSIYFDVPNEFDMSVIGSSGSTGFGYSIYHGSGSAFTSYAQFNTSNRTVTVYCWSGQTEFLQRFNRLT